MKKTWMPVLAAVTLAMAADGRAQEEPKGGGAQTPLQVEVVVARKQGPGATRLPYTITCNANQARSSLRLGIQVPVETRDKGMQYQSVGMSLDCRATGPIDGRYRLEIGVENSSIYEMKGASAGAAASPYPFFRSFNATFTALLRDGQSALYTAATDPVSGEEVTIEVALKAMK
jgi:hypothetical protein